MDWMIMVRGYLMLREMERERKKLIPEEMEFVRELEER